MDLRGSRETMKYKCKAPANIKEHIEYDVPDAIRFIKQLGHEKVFLVGHSLGGAISCAVAGLIPGDIAGVVHVSWTYKNFPLVPPFILLILYSFLYNTLSFFLKKACWVV